MQGIWQGFVNQPPSYASTMILLSDGRVMAQEEATAHWHALTPESRGSYANGDAAYKVAPDSSFMIGALLSGESAFCDPMANSLGGDQSVRTARRTWIMLPDHRVLTVDFPDLACSEADYIELYVKE